MTPLSVLDLSPVTTATPGSVALRNSLDLARLADRLGYRRYWFAEHHNLASIASSAPEIMIGQVAAATTRIRVGSGGVMLANHAPLMVAERFKVLEALFPGRIDLGLGRAPGTDPVTSYALRRRQDAGEADDFLERFQELILLERGGFPPEHPFRNVRAVPADVALPPIWLLGSSGYSAELAAAVGMGFAFAHHFAEHDAGSAMLSYREHFKPSETLPEPLRHPGGRRDRGRNRRRSRTNRRECLSALSSAARKANSSRSRHQRKPPPILIRRSTAIGSSGTASDWWSAAAIASNVGYWRWSRQPAPTS